MKVKRFILFFSKGQGTGHACRDIVLADCLSELDSNVEIKFASYADGYKALSAKGRTCVNIGPPAESDEHNRLIKMGQALREEKPDLVISDEELLALPLAKIFQIPSLLITNWFTPSPEHPTMSYFADPEEIIFPDLEGSFTIPSEIKPPVHSPKGYCTRRKQNVHKSGSNAKCFILPPAEWNKAGRTRTRI